MSELHLALLLAGPRHGYDLKRQYDDWFPDARPLAFGQVYATLGRLERDGLVEVLETRVEGGPERTVYAVTDAGRERLAAWLAEPAPPAGTGGEDVVRKTVVALRTASPTGRAHDVVARQRASHLRRMRDLQDVREGAGGGPDAVAARLTRRHAVLHLDADLRWLDEAVEALGPLAAGPAPHDPAPAPTSPASPAPPSPASPPPTSPASRTSQPTEEDPR